MSYLNSGLLSTYNSLTDKHLAGYFSNTRIRRHLRRAGLITRSGRIVSDKEYRLKLVRRDHQRHVRECLAQAIFHKVLNMEHQHQVEMKRALEEFSRRDRVHKLKMERSKRCDEDIMPLLSPKPPSGPRNGHKESPGPEEEHLESSESSGSSRPNTAPGKMLRPHWLQPIHRNKTSVQTSPGCRHQDSSDNSEQLLIGVDKDLRPVTGAEYSRGTSPYQLPLINFSTPAPPSTKRTLKGSPNAKVRGRRLRPTTAPNIPAVEKDSKFRKTSVHSNVSVTMVYYGKSVHLSHEDMDKRDEVKVFQQHCGGENLCIYKGKLMEEETFQFVSRRHQGFPFSLTFFLNGMQVDRLSSCCEFKHRVGSRLGGKHGHFGIIAVNGSSPCYKCIISMGLDKMPTPPKRTKEDVAKGSLPDNSQEIAKEAKEVEQDIEQDAQIHLQTEPREEQNEDESMETQAKDVDEDKANDDYNDDFDADDERGDDDTEETKPAVKDPSSSSDRRDSQVDKDDGRTVNHQREDEDKYSGSEFEEDVVAEDKKSPSCSYRSSPTREDSDSEAQEVGEAVRHEEGQLEREEVQLPEELPQTEIPACADEKDHHGQGEQKEEPDGQKSDASSPTPPQTTAGDTETHETEGEGTGSSGLELLDDASITHPQEGQEVGKSDAELNDGDNEAKPEECSGDSEPERAKSVQEILAEAIMEEVQSSPEPELSDTSTEEEDLPSEIKTAEQKSTGEQNNLINAEMKDEKTENPENIKEQKERIVEGENMSESKGLQAQESADRSQAQEVMKGEEHGTETDDTTRVEKNGLKETESQAGESHAQSEATAEKENEAEEIEAQPEATESVAEMIEAQTNETESQENESEAKVEGTDTQEKETGAEQTEAHSNETESQGNESEAKVEETYTQAVELGAEHTEAQSKEDESQGNESEAKVEGAEALKKETKEQDREAEGRSNVSEIQPEVTEAETEITEAHRSETESQENESVAKVEETAMLEKETGEELTETDSKEAEAQENESEAPMEGAETREKETDEKEKETKEQSNVSEAQPEVIEAETEMIEAHTNETESKGDESEAKEVEGTDALEKEIRSEHTEELAEGPAVRATATDLKIDVNETQAVGNETQGRGTEEHKEIEAQAENFKTELPEAQKEGNEAHSEIIAEKGEEMLTEKTEVPGKEPEAEDTNVPAEQTERRVKETEAEQSEAESKMTEAREGKTEALEERIEAPPEAVEGLEDNTEAHAEQTEGPENKSEAQMEGTDGQEEGTREEGAEGLEEVTDCKTEGVETQAAGTDTQGKETEAPETEEDAKVAEARVETKDSNMEGSEASIEGNGAQTDTAGAKAHSDDVEIWEKWTISWKGSQEARTEAAETKAEVNEALMKVNESGRSGARAEATEAQTGNLDTQANNAGDEDESMSKTASDNEDKSEQEDKVETQDESSKVKDDLEEKSNDSSGKYVSAANNQNDRIEQKGKEIAKYENNGIDKNDEIRAQSEDLEIKGGNDLEHASQDEVKRNEEETSVTYKNLEEKEAAGKDFDDDLREAKTEDREEIMKPQEPVASEGSKNAKFQHQGYIKNVQLNTEQETAKFGTAEIANGSKLKEHVMTGGTDDGEIQSIVDGGDEQVSEVFNIKKLDAEDEGKDGSLPTGNILREGDLKVEDPGKEATANHDQGGNKPKHFETGSKEDVGETTAADVEAGGVLEDDRSLSAEKPNKSNLLQSDVKDCAQTKAQMAADEFSNKSRSSILEESRGGEQNKEHEYKALEPKISEQRKSEEMTYEQRPDVSLTAKLIKPVMQMQEDRGQQIKDDDGEEDHFENGTKEYAVSGKPGSEDTKTGSKATPEELTSGQKSISSSSDHNRDTIKVKSRVAEGKDGDCVVEIERSEDDVEVKGATEGLLDSKNERIGTSHMTEEKVVGTFDDSIVQDVVEEDENDTDKSRREFAVRETATGEEVKISDALKSHELKRADKIMHLEHDTTMKARTNDELMKAEAEDDVSFSPEALVTDGSGDLVTSWVNKHQASRYFQTFTEPIEDLKGFSGHEGSEKKMAHTK